ncbi:4,5-dihydroxyphthalate decarboxylase PhtD [Cupriavidus basilensis OR16]|uniref:4,5-dihydroxyphthalate decarboxylase PhtD n=1 Tax=Cupriavidus basilensis OR16 TaxID=1127483 RepID=H1S8P0_9BURK|nr:ABC transporter substrate-binding protein [Cupriavidus basilensis]EHP41082.1 4,5-dihydroxyphthalate decarboxylase PhtD [Cupriavidus basilensis OR16]
MSKLNLSLAMGDYDRTRPLLDGKVPIDGVNPVFLTLDPEEIFFRAFRHAEFDVCELSLSSFTVKTARGECPYVGVPVFLSRAFRHTAIYVRTDRGIRDPADLRGRRVGVPEYQLTACVWVRAMLEEDHGVRPSELQWVRGGEEQPGRLEKINLALPADIRLESAADGATLNGMLATGEIDALIAPRPPSCWTQGHAQVGRLFTDPIRAASDYYRRTGIFPIMHLLGVRRELVQAHPWLPAALQKAFERAKAMAMTSLAEIAASAVTLPFAQETMQAMQALMGEDYWSYGVARNAATLDTFLAHHHAQGLSPRRVRLEELLHPSTFEVHRV